MGGGGYLPVPCTFAHGTVVDYEQVNDDGDLDDPLMWVVDFGTQYGVQRIREMDCELIRPRSETNGQGGDGDALPRTADDWTPVGEGAAANQIPYRWTRGRRRGRGQAEEVAEYVQHEGAVLHRMQGGLLQCRILEVKGGAVLLEPDRVYLRSAHSLPYSTHCLIAAKQERNGSLWASTQAQGSMTMGYPMEALMQARTKRKRILCYGSWMNIHTALGLTRTLTSSTGKRTSMTAPGRCTHVTLSVVLS
jgi:hypothetical protein